MVQGVLPGLALAPPETEYFNAELYLLANPDLIGLNPEQLQTHFTERGVAEGRRIIVPFDPNFYRIANPDLGGLNNRELFDHFINVGLDQGRRFSPIFDLDFYRKNLEQLDPEIITQLTPVVEQPVSPFIQLDPNRPQPPSLNENLFNLFLETQLEVETDLDVEGLGVPVEELQNVSFSPFFDPILYLNQNPTLAEAFGPNNRQKAIAHFALYGINENRRSSLIFDPKFYRENNPDLVAAGLTTSEQLLIHYQLSGIQEGRRPSLNFNPSFYLANNLDLQARGLTLPQLVEQYLLEGLEEGRRSSEYFDPITINSLLIPQAPPPATPPATDAPPPASSVTLLEENFVKWNVPVGGVLSYSFVETASALSYSGPESGVGEVNEGIKNNVRQIMEEYDEVLPFSLVEVPDRPSNNGQIRILFANNPAYAYSNAPGLETGGDIVLSRNYEIDPQLSFSQSRSNFGYQRLVHEIGHALGLRQPNNYAGFAFAERPTFPAQGPRLSFVQDNNSNTAMSFNIAGVGASTPMPYDIRALQFLYGFSDGNSGNDLYQFDGNNFIGVKQTIWDAGGIDTLDFSVLPAIGSYFFDMNEGGVSTNQSALNASTYLAINDPTQFPYSASSYGTYISYGTTLENLQGSPVNDLILGNTAANGINGGGGDDILIGGLGPDTLAGGPGRDRFVYAPGDGTDRITDFNAAEDFIALAPPLSFEGISVQASGADTLLRVIGTGEVLALLGGVNPNTLSPANFVAYG
ncbi:M10 family metallopeptidase [Laspinema olomoucense]|uniref:M10 family metallopeptidase n=1 Tax=Laspinema olomoucense D3b TaxID=2953688 RepID=A0ABT2N9I9_9CYAN|nr:MULTISPECIES: M10 family metallopeptidase [unclassified Laspinema]MCT7972254.1 M10 family metallopeptidase [Laspinema sp. D3d]MCT7978390.1 M10 family metallopeptidase [Laspinema sp. D3b]